MQPRIPPLKERRGYLCLSLMVSRKAWSVFSVGGREQCINGEKRKEGNERLRQTREVFQSMAEFLARVNLRHTQQNCIGEVPGRVCDGGKWGAT